MRVYSQEEASVKIGQEFGRLKVIGAEFSLPMCFPSTPAEIQRKRFVVSECRCGKFSLCYSFHLLGKNPTMSCGCLVKEKFHHTTHGQTGHPVRRVWACIKARCYNKKSTAYHNYGARGIKMCDEWRNAFSVFLAWALANGWEPGLDIDRRDNNGDYDPRNCRFVTRQVNANNRRGNRFLTAFGETKTIAEWIRDERCVVGRSAVDKRLVLNWNVEKAISTPSVKG